MYNTIESFTNDWVRESGCTIKILEALNDESLNQKVTPNGRTLGKLGWHLVETIGEMLTQAGIESFVSSEENKSSTVLLVDEYKKAAESVAPALLEKWKDENLNDKVNMYGEEWTKKDILVSLVKHEIHHRAQMTVLMRQAGLKVPGIYGPSFEEWQSYGMTPQE
jgi:uncharacterized damage-inducible protein DinB